MQLFLVAVLVGLSQGLTVDRVELGPGQVVTLTNPDYPDDSSLSDGVLWNITTSDADKTITVNCTDIEIIGDATKPCEGRFSLSTGDSIRLICQSKTSPFITMVSKTGQVVMELKSPIGGSAKLKCEAVSSGTAVEPRWNQGSPFFTEQSREVDSPTHGVAPGRRQTTCDCGRRNQDLTRIVGGSLTKSNEYPWATALIQKRSMQQFCGGTLLTPRVVLTASHCVYGMPANQPGIIAVLGGHDLRAAENRQHIDVQTAIMHEQYNHQMISNDVALLVLAREATLNRNVGLACAPINAPTLDNKYVKIVGWGKTSHYGNTSPILKHLNIRVVEQSKCLPRYPNMNRFERKQFCTHSNNQGACMGDSGGPVVWLNPETNRYTVMGAVSFGKICASTDPSVHTLVPAFWPWIQQKLSAYRQTFCY